MWPSNNAVGQWHRARVNFGGVKPPGYARNFIEDSVFIQPRESLSVQSIKVTPVYSVDLFAWLRNLYSLVFVLVL